MINLKKMNIRNKSDRYVFIPNKRDGDACFDNILIYDFDLSEDIKALLNKKDVEAIVNSILDIIDCRSMYRGNRIKNRGLYPVQGFFDLETRNVIRVEEDIKTRKINITAFKSNHPILAASNVTREQLKRFIRLGDLDVLDILG